MSPSQASEPCASASSATSAWNGFFCPFLTLKGTASITLSRLTVRWSQYHHAIAGGFGRACDHMEGITGVDTLTQTRPDGREYEKFRRIMTEEVNAAIAGAHDAGATEVLVSDSHGDAQNIDIELLDRKSTRLNSSHIPLSRMPSS